MRIQTATKKTGEAQPLYMGLDAFKLFFAVCVIAIHTYALNGAPEQIRFWVEQGVFRLAVPFFFVTSGFMLGRKLYEGDKSPAWVIGQYVKKWLPPLLLVGTANGFFELLLLHLRNGISFRRAVVQFVNHLVFYPYGAMWYVQACIIGALLLYPFLKRKKLDLALLIGAILYIWALLCNNYYFLTQSAGIDRFVTFYMNICVSGRNGVFVGFLWMALGIKTYEWHRTGIKSWKLKWGLLIFAALYLAEIYLLREQSYLDDRALYVTQTALVPIMTMCLLNLKLPIAVGASVLMRRASVWLYFSHRLFYVIGRILCFLAFGENWRGAGAFVIVLLVCMMGYAAVNVKKVLRLGRAAGS